MADIFLSHSSADSDAAEQIKSWLERDRENWSVFLDKHPLDGILAGQGWQDRLRSELQSCRVVLAIITPDWLASRWCFTEAVTATFRGKDFVGVLPGDLPAGALNVAPPIVHERQCQPIDLTTGDGWEELLHALDQSGLDPSHWFSIPEGVGPYPGFVAFEEKDAGVFFGRDAEITEYLDALNLLKAPDRAQALVISGGSGSGKSSLLKAGLIPRLRQQPDWLIVPPFDPSREPIHALFSALRAAAEATGVDIDVPPRPPQSVEDLTEFLQDSLRVIEEKANAWLLLSLDQAEILLAGSQGGRETDASRVLTAVGDLLASRTRKLVAVLTIRTEFMPALDRALPSAVRLHDRSLRSITALSEIIEKPAARFGIQLEEGLTGRMVEDTRGAEALPLLAYTLRELYEKYGDDNLLTVVEYEQLGGVEGAIEKKLHEALSDPEPTADELAAFRRCFVRQLVRVDESAVEGERYLRAAVARDTLPDDANRLVDRLQEARLLVGGDDGTIGIAHERLIRNWADVPLQTWLAEDGDDRKLIDNLKSFLAAHRDGGPLLSEKPLLDAKHFLERDRSLEDDEPELAQFIQASVTAEQTRQRRQKWLLGGAVAASLVFLVVAIGAVWFFFEAQEQTRVAEEQTRAAKSRQLAAQAQAAVQSEPQLSLLLAIEALDVTRRAGEPPVADSENVLWRALENTGGVGLSGHKRPVMDFAFSQDSRWVASASADGSVRLWNLDGEDPGTPLGQLCCHKGPIMSLAVTPDGNQAITVGLDGIRLWDMTAIPSVVEPVPLAGHRGGVYTMDLTSDGRWLVTGGKDGTARVWDLTAPDPAARPIILRGHTGPVTVVDIGPGNRLVATGGADGTARLWDLTSADTVTSAIVLRGHQGQIRTALIAANGHLLITGGGGFDGGGDGTVRLWDLTSDEQAASPIVLRGHKDGISALVLSEDDRWLVSGSHDGTLLMWDLTAVDPRAASIALTPHGDAVSALLFIESSKGLRLVSGSQDNTVRLWDLGALDPSTAFMELRGHGGGVNAVAISPDGRWLATGGRDNTARLWDLDRSDYSAAPVVLRGQSSWVYSLALRPDNRWLFSQGGDGAVRMWDLKVESPTRPTHVLPSKGSSLLEISADGRWLVTGGPGRPSHLWDLHARNPAANPIVPGRHESQETELVVSPDGRWLVTGDGETTMLWDLSSDDPRANRVALKGRVWDGPFVALSPSGQWLVTGGQGNPGSQPEPIRLWRTMADRSKADEFVLSGHTGRLRSAAISLDNHWLVTGADDDEHARAWDLTAEDPGRSPILLGGHRFGVNHVAISSDSRWLATVDHIRILLWDLTTIGPDSRPIALRGHEGGIRALAFSTNGRRLVTASGGAKRGGEGTVRLWNLAASDPARSAIVLRSESAVISIALSDDGHLLAGAGEGAIRLWNLRLPELVALACRTSGRNLTSAEWEQYFGGATYRKTCPNLPPDPSVLRGFIERLSSLTGRDQARSSEFEMLTDKTMATNDAAMLNTVCWVGNTSGGFVTNSITTRVTPNVAYRQAVVQAAMRQAVKA